jgi:hypothetical protein
MKQDAGLLAELRFAQSIGLLHRKLSHFHSAYTREESVKRMQDLVGKPFEQLPGKPYKTTRPLRAFRIPLKPLHPGIVWCAKVCKPDIDDHPGVVWFNATGENRRILGRIN